MAKRKKKAPALTWKRKQLRGISAKKKKEWYDSDKRYRIIWRTECVGVDIKEHYGSLYHASVRADMAGVLGWGRLGKGPPKYYRTLLTAQRACEAHKVQRQVRRR
jgi:hypothetical protein